MSDDLNLPKNRYLDSKKQETKSKMSTAMEEYKTLIKDKTHPDNQTAAYDTRVKSTLQRLLTAADELDADSPGEGIFGLIILSLRTNLSLKDEIIKLQSELRDLKIKTSVKTAKSKKLP